MNVALDTNILGYAEGIDDPIRQAAATAIVQRLRAHTMVLPAQVLGELSSILLRKARFPAETCAATIGKWVALATIQQTDAKTIAVALELAITHRLQFWDAAILAAAAEAECQLLLSEDMQDGFVWRGVTVANPFAASPHPLLASL